MGNDSVSRRSFLAGADHLRFRSKGGGPIHALVPLSNISDERCYVYLGTTAAEG
jgi:hypothetical protein